MSGSDRRPGAARRAVVRWAWRLFRREWRQQLTVLTLMTMAVAAAVAGATLAVASSAPDQAEFGDAGALARVDATDAGAARAAVAGVGRRWGTVEVIGHRTVPVPGSVQRLDVRTQDPAGTFGRPLLSLQSGRYPATPDEVALTDGAAELLSVGVGARVELGGSERTVVGRVENPTDLRDDFALLAPDGGATAEFLTLLFPEPGPPAPGSRPEDDQEPGPIIGMMVRGSDGPLAALVLVAMTLAMALVGLIAASGFVVVAQRRQRQLGMLAVLGATERHLRLVMLANGAIVGGVAAAAGTALGLSGWVLAAPAAERAANHRIDRLDVPWALVAAGALLAVVMGAAAAWWPTRNLARLPVMAALSGRPSRPAPVRRSLTAALALLGLGTTGIAAALPAGRDVRPLLLIAGVLAVVVGIVLAAPAAIRVLGWPAGRLPIAVRLALRDLVRYQARAAAALAAITLALGISVGVIGIANANEYEADEGNLSDRQLVIRAGDDTSRPDPAPVVAERAGLDARAQRVAAVSGGSPLIALDVALAPPTADVPNVREPITVAERTGERSWRFVGIPYVATPELLRHLGIDPRTVSDATDLLTVHAEVSLLDFTKRPEPAAADAVQRIDVPPYTSGPSSLVTESALRRHGWIRAPAAWLLESERPLTAPQIAAARSAAADLGLRIETRSQQDELAMLRTVATTAGALLALAVVAMTIGLIRGEGTRDLRTLTATGAARRTRRTLTASTAGALAILGVTLGTAGAYAALSAGYHADLAELTPVPVDQLLLLALGLPVAAIVTGWLLAGREPRSFSRQSLE